MVVKKTGETALSDGQLMIASSRNYRNISRYIDARLYNRARNRKPEWRIRGCGIPGVRYCYCG